MLFIMRPIIIFECEDAPYSMVFHAPKGMEVFEAQKTADDLVSAYNEAFDFDSNKEHEPQNALTSNGFEMAEYAVMNEKW